MPAGRSEVAIVGGGVVGLACARALALLGATDVVLFERGAALGQESTARAMGGVRAQFMTRGNIEFSRFSIAELERLDDSSGGLLRFHQKGYLMFTGREETAEALGEAVTLQRSLGIETEWLGPEEIVEKAPFVRADGLIAGSFHARDGFLDPHGVVLALARAVKELGVRVKLRSEVSGIGAGADGLELQLTEGGHVARWVVNAAGAWAGEVARLAGSELDVRPVRRNLAYVQDPGGPTELIPMCVDLDTGVLCRREEHSGYVLAYSDPKDAPGWATSVDPKFLDDLAERVGNRFPLLEELPIDPRHCWAGLYPETPDHHALIGRDAEVEGLVHCAGFGGHGIMHAPAAGRAVAELVTSGELPAMAAPFDPGRFSRGEAIVEAAVF